MIEVRQTKTKGRGVFATREIPAGGVLGFFTTGAGECFCTMVGDFRYANHSSKKPNIDWVYENDAIIFRALRDIGIGEELVYDYDCALWFTPIED
jgi:SET domain-containing protein